MTEHLVTPPVAEPVTLADAKAHLSIIHDSADARITTLLTAARSWAEEFSGRRFMTQTWDAVLDTMPATGYLLTYGPVQSAVLSYRDEDGDLQQLDAEDVVVDLVGRRIRVPEMPAVLDTVNAIRIRYVVGYANAELVPAGIKGGILLKLESMFGEVDSAVSASMSLAAEHLLWQHRQNLGV